METPQPNEITALLRRWREGDSEAFDELMPIVYQELRKLAEAYMRKERSDHTLQPTALINEAWMRLVKQNLPDWQSRKHFYGVAAQMMRQVLVEHARSHAAAKRGGGLQKLSLDEALTYSVDKAAELIQLDDALTTLAEFDERKVRIVEMRYFGGLSLEETADVMELSVPTIVREMRMAHAWLHREMSR